MPSLSTGSFKLMHLCTWLIHLPYMYIGSPPKICMLMRREEKRRAHHECEYSRGVDVFLYRQTFKEATTRGLKQTTRHASRVISSSWVDKNTEYERQKRAHRVKLFFRRVCRGPLLGECENSWTCIFHLIVRTSFGWVERQERTCQVHVHKQACTDAPRTHLTVVFWGSETVNSQSTRTLLRCKKPEAQRQQDPTAWAALIHNYHESVEKR